MAGLLGIHIVHLFGNYPHRFMLLQLLHLLLRSLLPLVQLSYIVFRQLYRLLYVRVLLAQTLVLPLLVLALVHLLRSTNCRPKSIGIPTRGCSSPISHETRPISLPKLDHVGNSCSHF